jgi:hypothetical protein
MVEGPAAWVGWEKRVDGVTVRFLRRRTVTHLRLLCRIKLVIELST